MKTGKTLLRRIGRWALRLAVIGLMLFGLQITVLAFPQLFLSDSVQSGAVTIHYDAAHADAMTRLAAEVDKRLRGSGYYDPARTQRVFFFQSQGLYTMFARLSLVTPRVQGFCLSVFDNAYVSGPRIAAAAKRAGRRPRHSLWEGSPAHIIAHEIAHGYLVDKIGRSQWTKLPHWKQEGFPEYAANIVAIREDSLATLRHRIAILGSEDWWGGWNGWDRKHYEAELLFEFLHEVKAYTLDEIMADSVTREATRSAMMAWYAAQEGGHSRAIMNHPGVHP